MRIVHLFVSYARPHQEKVRDFVSTLRNAAAARGIGIEVHLDEHLNAGDPFKREIRRMIYRSHVFVAALSDDFFDSDFIIGLELAAARTLDLPIVPIEIERCERRWEEVFPDYHVDHHYVVEESWTSVVEGVLRKVEAVVPEDVAERIRQREPHAKPGSGRRPVVVCLGDVPAAKASKRGGRVPMPDQQTASLGAALALHMERFDELVLMGHDGLFCKSDHVPLAHALEEELLAWGVPKNRISVEMIPEATLSSGVLLRLGPAFFLSQGGPLIDTPDYAEAVALYRFVRPRLTAPWVSLRGNRDDSARVDCFADWLAQRQSQTEYGATTDALARSMVARLSRARVAAQDLFAILEVLFDRGRNRQMDPTDDDLADITAHLVQGDTRRAQDGGEMARLPAAARGMVAALMDHQVYSQVRAPTRDDLLHQLGAPVEPSPTRGPEPSRRFWFAVVAVLGMLSGGLLAWVGLRAIDVVAQGESNPVVAQRPAPVDERAQTAMKRSRRLAEAMFAGEDAAVMKGWTDDDWWDRETAMLRNAPQTVLLNETRGPPMVAYMSVLGDLDAKLLYVPVGASRGATWLIPNRSFATHPPRSYCLYRTDPTEPWLDAFASDHRTKAVCGDADDREDDMDVTALDIECSPRIGSELACLTFYTREDTSMVTQGWSILPGTFAVSDMPVIYVGATTQPGTWVSRAYPLVVRNEPQIRIPVSVTDPRCLRPVVHVPNMPAAQRERIESLVGEFLAHQALGSPRLEAFRVWLNVWLEAHTRMNRDWISQIAWHRIGDSTLPANEAVITRLPSDCAVALEQEDLLEWMVVVRLPR